MIAEISGAIDELSNLKTLGQLQKENRRAQESNKALEKESREQEARIEQAQLRMKHIEADEKERCQKTASILKDFTEKSGNGPFFESLLAILTNFQGYNKFNSEKLFFLLSFTYYF